MPTSSVIPPYTYVAASTEDITLFVKTIAELEWSDFVEVEPGHWYPHSDSMPKILWLKGEVKVRLAEIEAYDEERRRSLGETWFAAKLV